MLLNLYGKGGFTMNVNKIDDFLNNFTEYPKFYSPEECYLLQVKELLENSANYNETLLELSDKINLTLLNLDKTQLATIINVSQHALEISNRNDKKESVICSLSQVVNLRATKIKFERATRLEFENKVFSLKNLFPLNEMSNWDNFIVRDKNWDQLSLYNTQGTQEPYGRRMQQAVACVTDIIKKNASFEEACNYSAVLRSFIARDLSHENPEDFGTKRTFSALTPLGGIYKNLGVVLNEMDQKFRTEENSPFYKIIPCVYNPAMRFGAIMGLIGKEEIELSNLAFYPGGSGSIAHTLAENIPIIMNYAKDLYQQALAEEDPTKVYKLAGEMFWWICQAKPWERGDPSIAEILVRSIFASKQISNQPWREGIVPWAEAMKDFNPENFSDRFATLFVS